MVKGGKTWFSSLSLFRGIIVLKPRPCSAFFNCKLIQDNTKDGVKHKRGYLPNLPTINNKQKNNIPLKITECLPCQPVL
jgi:hypothetical protein